MELLVTERKQGPAMVAQGKCGGTNGDGDDVRAEGPIGVASLCSNSPDWTCR